MSDGPGSADELDRLLEMRFAAHPWHGVGIGERAPEEVSVYVEIVPTDSLKYELDKTTGHLKVDRPNRYSTFYPTLYGFIPQTFCGERVGARCSERTGLQSVEGDGDPIDICVLSERDVHHPGVLLRAHPIGGLRMLDGNQADDKIVAVLAGDPAYDQLRDIWQLPGPLLDRLRHFFLTYKQFPGEQRKVEIREVYDRTEAYEMIRRSQTDYAQRYGDPAERDRRLKMLLR